MPVEIELKVSRRGIEPGHAQAIRVAFEQSSISAQSVVKLAPRRTREVLGRLHIQFVAIRSGSVAPADPCSPTKTGAPFLKIPQRKAGRVSQSVQKIGSPAEGVVGEQAPGRLLRRYIELPRPDSRRQTPPGTRLQSACSRRLRDPLPTSDRESIPEKRRHAARPQGQTDSSAFNAAASSGGVTPSDVISLPILTAAFPLSPPGAIA